MEKFGLEAIPNELKKTSFFEYFILQLAFSVNSGNFLVPALAVLTGGLSFYAAILSTVLGVAAAFLLVSLLSLPGANNGLPAQYAIRSILGTNVARFIASPIRTITSLYWFCVQTIGGTIVFIELIHEITGLKFSFTPIAMIFAVIMGLLALYGFETVKKAVKWFLPVLITGQIVLLIFFIRYQSTNETLTSLSNQDWNYQNFFLFASIAFVQYVSGVSASSDMARYAKSAKIAFWGLFTGNTFGFFMTALLAAFSASLLGEWNPFVGAVAISHSIPFTALILLCSMVSMISINMNNAYTGGFSLLNTFHGIGRIKSSIIFGLAAVGLSLFPVLIEEAQTFISYLGAFIIPVSAVIVIDFLYIQKASLSEELLSRVLNNRYPINFYALWAMLIGSIIYLIFPKNASPGFVSFFVTGLVYFCIHIIGKRKKRL
ncbi:MULTISPECIES: cytosine permease [unclassified Bacillus (in: firmicutes)]|uniref:purine-cytosine permease family protein n=1 Tax=unclassified Bacillus (in: firmicutes) TaxID=185979 RepID=UPI0020C8ED3B|nr:MULTISPECIES: cytosine permease [unclassified Bacillus (in: firmicutes)]